MQVLLLVTLLTCICCDSSHSHHAQQQPAMASGAILACIVDKGRKGGKGQNNSKGRMYLRC